MISNDVAIVTGASQGVGRTLAIGLAREASIAAEAGVPDASVLPIKLALSNPGSSTESAGKMDWKCQG
jgi:NAD(P)-dependent dehydrogenase (short-subunit alcohol dehydrogenase family)